MGNSNYSSQVIHGDYFPHIDGIRALAVLPVVLFHLLASFCPGGFVGVDVFFVISGYLITGGILRDLQNNRFSIRGFYYRRIRRIMPAYFALIAGVFIIGCALFFATPLIHLGDSVVAGTLFIANYNFWMLAGDYFAPTLHSEALLHLWSLSVEEQFYFIIPLLCVIIWNIRPGLVIPALALLTAISLFGAIHAVMTGKQNDAFYLLHFRAWELLTGSLLATLPAASKSTATQWYDHPLPARKEPQHGDHTTGTMLVAGIRYSFLGTIGCCLVIFSYATISSQSHFPGAAVLAPVAGTALLIRYGHHGRVCSVLSSSPFVLTGKMSYSLYLWHWPVIVYWKYAAYDQLYSYDYIGMFVLSLLLGYLSWRFVELPVRTSSAWTMRRSFIFATVGIAMFVVIGTACVYNKGWPTILHSNANNVAYMPFPKDPLLLRWPLYLMRYISSKTGCSFRVVTEHEQRISQERKAYFVGGLERESSFGSSGRTEVFLLGDSHAGHLKYGLDIVLQERSIAGYCMDYGAGDTDVLKQSEIQLALDKLADLPHVSHVIIANMWARRRFQKQGHRQDHEAAYYRIEKFAIAIKGMNKIPVIVTDVPCYPYPPADMLARTQIIAPRQMSVVLDSYQQTETEYDRVNGELNGKLESICVRTGGLFLPLHLAFKEGDHFVSVETHGGKNVPLYRDTDHLTAAGSVRAARFIALHLIPTRTE